MSYAQIYAYLLNYFLYRHPHVLYRGIPVRYICLCVNVFISSVPSVPPAVKGNKEVREKSQGGGERKREGESQWGSQGEREGGGGIFIISSLVTILRNVLVTVYTVYINLIGFYII